jgi:hypothetical protein
MEQLSRGRRGEPSLRDAIAESGETAIDPNRSAIALELEDRRFLGREFLTWLIYHADDENGGGQFAESKSGDAFRIIVGERVVLKALGEGSGEISARGVAPATTPDVRYAIAGGLTVREVDLIFEQRSGGDRSERLWQAAVSAEGFDLRRVKLPSLLSEEDDEKLNERLALLDELERMLKSAFDSFLRTRLQPSWQSEELPRLRGWLAHSILEERQLALFEAGGDGKGPGRRRPGGK